MNGHTTQYEYDAAGRRTAVIDALGHRTEMSRPDDVRSFRAAAEAVFSPA